jgi:hypothetical protein
MVPSRIGTEKWRGSAGVKRSLLLAKTGAAVVHEAACSQESAGDENGRWCSAHVYSSE